MLQGRDGIEAQVLDANELLLELSFGGFLLRDLDPERRVFFLLLHPTALGFLRLALFLGHLLALWLLSSRRRRRRQRGLEPFEALLQRDLKLFSERRRRLRFVVDVEDASHGFVDATLGFDLPANPRFVVERHGVVVERRLLDRHAVILRVVFPRRAFRRCLRHGGGDCWRLLLTEEGFEVVHDAEITARV